MCRRHALTVPARAVAEPKPGMFLATFFPYLQRQHSFSSADLNGAWRAHHDLLRVALSRNIVDEAHLFVTSAGQSDGPPISRANQDAVRELIQEFGENRIHVKNGAELPLATAKTDYVFVEKAPALYRLAHARLAIGTGAYPICSLVNSVCFRDMLNSFVGLLVAAEPHDALVVTSDAGLGAVRESLRQAKDFLKEQQFCTSKNELTLVKIPLGVEEQTFGSLDRSFCRRALGIPTQSTLLLYVGRFSDEYKADLEPVLLAFRELAKTDSNLLLLLAGQDIDSRYSKHLENLADDLEIGTRVKVIVNFPPALKPIVYGAGDIFVSPADNIEETFGLAILEAMSSGLPVVCSDWSGYRDTVVHEKTGFLVPTLWNEAAAEVLSWLAPISENPTGEAYLARRTILDIRAFTTYLRALIENEELRKRLGNAGRQRVLEFFTWDHVIKRYGELWREQIKISKVQPKEFNRATYLDFNRIFSHYASGRVDLTTAIRPSTRGRAIVAGSTQPPSGLGSEGFSAGFVKEALRILEMCEQPTTIEVIVNTGGPHSYDAAVWLLKKGLCEFCLASSGTGDGRLTADYLSAAD